MKSIGLFVLLVMIAGCEPMTEQQVSQSKLIRPFGIAHAMHDDARGVTCWVVGGDRGISCLPDWMLTKPEVKP